MDGAHCRRLLSEHMTGLFVTVPLRRAQLWLFTGPEHPLAKNPRSHGFVAFTSNTAMVIL